MVKRNHEISAKIEAYVIRYTNDMPDVPEWMWERIIPILRDNVQELYKVRADNVRNRPGYSPKIDTYHSIKRYVSDSKKDYKELTPNQRINIFRTLAARLIAHRKRMGTYRVTLTWLQDLIDNTYQYANANERKRTKK